MRILSIETSADETAVSLVKATGDFPTASYEIAGNALHSQVALHTQYGGIFPAMAKREHAKAIIPLLQTTLTEAELLHTSSHSLTQPEIESLKTLLHREEDLAEVLIMFLEQFERPEIDLIAVTTGPGLEPALWVGLNTAKALATIWNIPIVPINHMEGHLLASIFDVEIDDSLAQLTFPTLGLLISGGHTEFIHIADWGSYKKIGQTRDDAVGEAFDKVARLIGLPYPGGPEIERAASLARSAHLPVFTDLPRPMMHSGDLDFSFSGLKTAVRYAVEGKTLSETDIQAIARDFSDAVAEVLLKKTRVALDQTGSQNLIVGGGVSASQHLRTVFHASLLESHPDVTVYFPIPRLSTDNAIMIALAGHAHTTQASNAAAATYFVADGNRSLSE